MMKLLWLLCVFCCGLRTVCGDEFDDNVFFVVHLENGTQINSTESIIGCDPNEKFALIIHGWTESSNSKWALDLVKNLRKHRGGCIMVMDYFYYSETLFYLDLLEVFEDLVKVVYMKLYKLQAAGFDLQSKGYIFGFSFGSRLAVEGAALLGHQKVNEVDLCDMAGPGFVNVREMTKTMLVAVNTQCIHTSNDKGVYLRECHQDWNMGCCGKYQIAAGLDNKISHGLCPVLYNLAFTKNFYAVPNVFNCTSRREVKIMPDKFKMGYMENRKEKVLGDLYAVTTANPPFSETLEIFKETAPQQYLDQCSGSRPRYNTLHDDFRNI